MSDPISDNIRRLREAYGYTQEELARRIGATRETVWAYEKGRVSPRYNEALKLAKELGVRIDELGSEDMQLPEEHIQEQKTVRKIEELAEVLHDEGIVDVVLRYLAEEKGAIGDVTSLKQRIRLPRLSEEGREAAGFKFRGVQTAA